LRFQPDVFLLRLPSWDNPSASARFIMDLAAFASRPVIALMTAEELRAQGKPWPVQSVALAPYDIDRITAQLRAVPAEPPASADSRMLQCGDVLIDMTTRRVQVNGEPVDLVFSEFELLVRFCRDLDRVLTREDLVLALGSVPRTLPMPAHLRVVDVYVLRLRQKLRGARRLKIETVHRVGYRCVALPEPAVSLSHAG
jgi:DNA-binding response OmpR family regulator